MRKILYFIIAAIPFCSCSLSNKNKVETLIDESMKKILYHVESYDPIETRLDSAFSPFDDPVFYDKTLKLCKLSAEIEKCNRSMKSAKSEMARYKDYLNILYSNEDKEKYNQAKEKYEDYIHKQRGLIEKAKITSENLKSELQKEQRFIGMKAWHRYRAKNNNGQIVIGEMKFLFDKNLTQVIDAWDMDSEEYKMVQMAYKQMRGEEVFPEDLGEDYVDYDFE